MIKAEMYDLGRYNGMAEPDPDGSYHGLEIRTAAETQTFLIPAHQLPADNTRAKVVKAAQEAAPVFESCIEDMMSAYHDQFDGVWSQSEFEDIERPYREALATLTATLEGKETTSAATDRDWKIRYLRNALKKIEMSTNSRDQGTIAMAALAATDEGEKP